LKGTGLIEGKKGKKEGFGEVQLKKKRWLDRQRPEREREASIKRRGGAAKKRGKGLY